jgi:hypothetical protein
MMDAGTRKRKEGLHPAARQPKSHQIGIESHSGKSEAPPEC